MSALLIDCSQLDSVSTLTQLLLSAALSGTVADSESNMLDTSNLLASATRDALDIGANIVLSTGVQVFLSAAALAQFVPSTAAITAATFDTAASAVTLAVDTRVVTFADQWASCRSSSGAIVSSQITTIDFTLSNGQLIDVSELLAPFSFTLPFNASAVSVSVPAPVCPGLPSSSVLSVAAADALLASSLLCGYWDLQNSSFSTAGCRNEGLTKNDTAVMCSCGHTTEVSSEDHTLPCFCSLPLCVGSPHRLLLLLLCILSLCSSPSCFAPSSWRRRVPVPPARPRWATCPSWFSSCCTCCWRCCPAASCCASC